MKRAAPKTAALPVIACLAPAVIAVGCGNSPPPEVPTPPAKAAEKPRPRGPLELPARAVRAARDGARRLGTLDNKRVYSVGGERWVVSEDGRVEREKAPFGDALEHVVSLPRGPVVGWNAQRAYTFADVLGPPKLAIETTSPFTHVRPGPNAVLLFSLYSGTAIDLATGLERGGLFPSFPLRDAIFVDAQRGVVATAVGGVATTVDAGKTWTPARHSVKVSPTLDLWGTGTDVYLKEIYTGRVARVDIDKAELRDWGSPNVPAPPEPAPIERWITAWGNPIHSAVKNGIDAGNKTGVVAFGDVVARVDLATGLFVETARIDGSSAECRGAMAGEEAYLLCGIKDKRSGEQLYRVKTRGKLEAEAIPGAIFAGAGSAEIVGSGAGGLVVLQGCGDKWGSYCVRQPGGKFAAVEPSLMPYRDVVPLADGRLAGVGVRAGETGQILEVIAATARERTVLQDAAFDEDTAVAAAVPQQTEDGLIHFLVREIPRRKNVAHLYVYSLDPTKKGFRKTALPELTQASLGDGALVAVAKDGSKIQVSHDLGLTFQDLDMPPGASLAFSEINRLGVASPSHTRVGYAPLREGGAADKPAPQIRLRPTAPVAKEMLELSCTAAKGGKPGVILPKHGIDLVSAFGVKAAPKGTRRVQSTYSTSALETSLLLLLEGKEAAAGQAGSPAPDRWSVYYMDPTEVSPKVRTLSTKAPSPSRSATVRAAWSQESKLLFSVELDGKSAVARSKGSGVEISEVHSSLLPSAGSPAAFSQDGSLIAYLAGEVLVLWRAGEAPRPISALNQRAGVVLGAPTKEGVPVLVDLEGQSYYRVFPLPTDKPSAPPEDTVVSAAWDGWTRSVTLLGGRGPVALCSGKPAGARFHSTSFAPNLWARVQIDGGAASSTSLLRYDVITDGQALCVESATVSFLGGIKVDVGGGAKKPPEYYDVLRIGARGKKGELSQSGSRSKPVDRAMTCVSQAAGGDAKGR